MKKTKKVLGIIALIAVIGFAAIQFTGCPVDEPKETLRNNAIALFLGTWTDAEIPSVDGEQWFTFVALNDTQYIHLELGTFTYGKFQLYESDAATMVTNGDKIILGVGGSYSLSLTSGSRYYIQVTGAEVPTTSNMFASLSGFGTFKIAFSNDQPPAITVPSDAIQLTIGTPADGNMPALGFQWFKFTAPDKNIAYIKFEPETYNSWNQLVIQMYDEYGGAGESINVSYEYPAPIRVTANKVYYFRATGSIIFSGAYKISVNNSFITGTGNTIDLGTETWSQNAQITDQGEEKWFKFTATADMYGTAFIHFWPGTLTDAIVYLFDSTGNKLESKSFYKMFSDSAARKDFFPATVTTGSDYYIKVIGYYSSSDETYTTGTFKVAASEEIYFGTNTATRINDGKWSNGNLSGTTTDGYKLLEDWFLFQATATTQYIHYKKGVGYLSPAYIAIYDIKGNMVGTEQYIGSSYSNKWDFSATVTFNSIYYLRVRTTSTSETDYICKVGMTDSETPPADD